MLAPGVVLDQRYRLDAHLATGGMGDVWRATDVLLARTVAVKVLLPALLSDPGFDARFRAEARMLAALQHRGVVAVYDFGEAEIPSGGRAPYLVMEYVDGQSLSVRLTEVGRLGVGETLSVVVQAARALDAAHAAGIVHRDVKPGNLLVHGDGTVTLVDFGVARSTAMTAMTGTNAVLGTALYMAPEQATSKPVSGATDIYALGAVAYHLLAGRPPFDGDNPLQVAVSHLHEDPPPLPADVPAPVAALVEKALAKDPADRFPTAAEFAEAAEQVAATIGDGTAAPAPTTTATLPAATAAMAAVDADPDSGERTAPIAAAAVPVRAAGPSTLTDQEPVPVPVAGGPPGGDRRRRTLLGVAAAVLLAGGVLVGVLSFAPDAATPPAEGPTPTATPSPTSSGTAEPSGETEPSSGRTGGSAPTSTGPAPTASASPSASPEPTAEEPSPEPTPPPTSAPTPPPTSAPTPPPTAQPTGGGGDTEAAGITRSGGP
ncbi:serine/threonine-protein kinase [Polymorphospora sp. NPDC051019]|uniref:serine/threonine-protein kinase n=1 Tax=Polymorphospora sp. NPDC051019 TaxID=3155725 RepID=UPI0034295937